MLSKSVVQVITDAKQYRVGPFNWKHSSPRICRELNVLDRIEGTSSTLASYSSNKGIASDGFAVHKQAIQLNSMWEMWCLCYVCQNRKFYFSHHSPIKDAKHIGSFLSAYDKIPIRLERWDGTFRVLVCNKFLQSIFCQQYILGNVPFFLRAIYFANQILLSMS